MEFVLIHPDSFMMGSDKGTTAIEGAPVHKVTLTKPFYLGKYEVTQEQWEKITGSNRSYFKGPKNPVDSVSWNACQGFVAKLNEKVPGRTFRLPTEAEWEYACRAGATGDDCFPAGEGALAEYAWYGTNAFDTTHPVGEKKPNAWGLHDMLGNVLEWCADWYGEYPASAVTDPQGPLSGSRRVHRGSAWTYDAKTCSATLRGWDRQEFIENNHGLRLALDAVPGEGELKPDSPKLQDASITPPPSPLVEGDFSYTVKDGVATIVKYTAPGGEVKIPEKINGLPVTEIGQRAFQHCTGLINITLPNGITTIHANAFIACTGLTRITIPASVTNFGAGPFSYCSNLSSITVDSANKTFSSANGIVFDKNGTSLLLCPEGLAGTCAIPDKVTVISKGAFAGCSKITGVTFPDNLTTIADRAFTGCTKLTAITIPAGVAAIGSAHFRGCSALTAITVDAANAAYSSADGVLFDKLKTNLIICPEGKTGDYVIPGGVTKINPAAFTNCAKLTGVTIPDSVTGIGDVAFSGCASLAAIKIPASVATIGIDVFLDCGKLVSIAVDAANPNFSSTGDGVIFNKDKTKLIRCPVSKASGYTVPDGVTSIERRAFNGCVNLTEITLPDSVTQICDDYVFSGCPRLVRVDIGKGVRSIGKYAFNYCTSLSSVLFKGDAPKGDADATIFNRVTKATVCHLPESKGWGKTFAGRPTALTDPDGAFIYTTVKGAVAIKQYIGPGGSVTIPDKINGLTVTSIGGFSGCTQVTGITIPTSVTHIENFAFDGCSGLTKVMIPASVSFIGWGPFMYCTGLVSITVDGANPAFCSSADGVLFSKDMTKLVSYPAGREGGYVIPDGVTYFGVSAFMGCSKLTAVAIPESTTSLLNGSVFRDCTALATVTLPKSLTLIGSYQFQGCTSLISMTIPAKVATFNTMPFRHCKNLKALHFLGDAPALGERVFEGPDNLTVYFLPTAKGWGKEFGGRPTAPWDPNNPFTFTTENGAVTITKYIGPGGDVVIPDKINGLPVTVLGDWAMDGCCKVTSLKIPGSVTSIGALFFGFFDGRDCKSVTIDEANPAYSSDADGVILSKDKTKLIKCLPNKVGAYAIPDSVASIETFAFHGCRELTDITIPATVRTIGDYAFGHCTGIRNIAISPGVTRIGTSAFYYCTALSKAAIPATVNSIGDNPYRCCFGLTSITVDTANPAFSSGDDGVLFDKAKAAIVMCPPGKVGAYVIPDSVTQMKPGAFRGCGKLTEIKLPAKLETISSRGFAGCSSVARMIVPPTVSSIGYLAFSGNGSLEGLVFKGNAPSLGGKVFEGSQKATIYHLPTAKGWGKEFGGRPTAVWDGKGKAEN